MKLNEAIIKRINEVCREKGLSVCEASLNGGKSPSAIYDLVKGRTKCSKVVTIQRFCEGAGITLSEFFDREYFRDLED
ncbi:MAG: helix-turn-helix transcriptional regulator [Clostridia bacterium]|nr:helix-turn-helix transcriptional regulator [Clostridia bacterium]